MEVHRLFDVPRASGTSVVYASELNAPRRSAAPDGDLWSLLDVFPRAVILVGRGLEVTGMNAAARTIVAHSSLIRVGRSGRLCVDDPKVQAELAAAADGARTCAAGEIALLSVVCSNTGEARLDIAAMRLGCGTVAFIVADRKEATVTCPQALRKLYGLTATEQKVASALVGGLSPTEVGAAMRISMNTVRRHMKQIFAKCHVTRQADLVRMITCGPAMLRCDQIGGRPTR